MNQIDFEFRPSRRTLHLLRALVAIGAVTVAAGLILTPQRMWPDLLLASYLVLCMGLAGTFFIALQYATGSGWSVSFRRVPEAMSVAVPVGAVGLFAVLLIHPELYPWVRRLDHASAFKQFWLSLPFFLGRAAVYVAIWVGFTCAIVRTSRRQDRDGNLLYTRRNVKLSYFFLVLFSITFWLASFDWIMSLEPDWYSTIFGVYNFAGLFSGGLAVLILLVLWMRSAGPLRDFVNEEHLHDLGKLLFAFCTFWMYIWFSQYMLIWYANISEETAYFVRRTRDSWETLFLVNMLLNWAVPFVALLPRGPKRRPAVLARVAAVVLLGRCLDLYLMIAPPFTGAKPAIGIWEAGTLAGAAGLFLLIFLRAVRQAAPVPINDPCLVESLHYHN